MPSRRTVSWRMCLLAGLGLAVTACGSSGGGGGGPTPGTLSFSVTSISVPAGSTQSLTLSLASSSGVTGLAVAVSTDDTSTATVTPATCPLSTGGSCTVTVAGVQAGNTTLRAHAAGYTDATVPVTVSPPSGTLNFGATSLPVLAGSSNTVTLSLAGSTGVAGLAVTLSTDGPSIATVGPSPCTLSSTPVSSASCTVTVLGVQAGTTTLRAQAAGYTDATLPVSVGNTVVYGALAVEDATGTYVQSSPVNLTYPAAGAGPYTFHLRAQLVSSSGIVTATGANINFAASAPPGVTFNPPQCPVTSASPFCDTDVTITSAASVAFPVTVAGAVAPEHTYNSITVNATPDTTPSYGSILVRTQVGNTLYNGFKAPLWVNWKDPGGITDTVTVNLSIQGTGATFYSFAPGTNTQIQTSTTQTCSLSTSTSGGTSTLGCGFGLVATLSSGQVTVTGTATSTSGHTYPIENLVLGLAAPEPAARTITFTNSSSTPVFLGITGGAAASLLSPTRTTVPPGTPSANVKPGAASTCGLTNPAAACPVGSTCLQGGAHPSITYVVGDPTATPYYCYYDQGTPGSYTLAANGGTTTLSISGSSLSPQGIIWSGNFYARTGCDATGACTNATCTGALGGYPCGPGTGPTPGVNTLAEVTFQNSIDYYDVSIINGANFAAQFGPTGPTGVPGPTGPAGLYYCTNAGSPTAQPAAGGGLGAAPWSMGATVASFPPGATLDGDPSSYFWMVDAADGANTCTQQATCATSGLTCGFRVADVSTQYTFATRYCGQPISWITADAIWGTNMTATNVAPFLFTTNFIYPSTVTVPAGSVTVGDLQLCINSSYSSYISNWVGTPPAPPPQQPLELACGGVMWGATEIPGPLLNPAGNAGLNITTPAQVVQTANQNWLTYVLPTIQWLKVACPTCYTFPFDDMSSSFTCGGASNYAVQFSNLN
jgi:hypothetical protein